jgi:error-prone DNA polymerase
VDGLQKTSGQRVMMNRDAPYVDVGDLKSNAALDVKAIRQLAAADTMRSMGIDRRQALWQSQALKDAPALPIFEHAQVASQGREPEFILPKMAKAEHVVADYQTLHLSLKAHPLSFYRTSLRSQGFTASGDLPNMRHGQPVSLAGLVLVRQKPGSAKGVCFITLEDETGVANLVIWPKMFKAYRPIIMSTRLMVVHGQVQTDGRVIHIVANDLQDRSDRLSGLSEATMPEITTRGDHPTHPIPSQVGMRGHPRNVRIIPKSHDFH